VKPRRRFAQHFLEPAWVRKVVEAIDPAPDDLFLEIGPGTGGLTLALAPHVKRITAIERDRDLAAELAPRVPSNVSIEVADVLRVNLADHIARRFGPNARVRVAGNLPYNISSPILFTLLQLHLQTALLIDATLLLQREVVERIVAVPGTKDYGVLSIMLQLHADATRLMILPPGAFRPSPEVTSALVRLRYRSPAVHARDPLLFERVVRTIFQQRRKTVANALKPLGGTVAVPVARALDAAGIDGTRRPETLSLEDLCRLADGLAGHWPAGVPASRD
jgi:16S rRNA (adenine1518-N6/adenine1519-N6)-dimethyltransferase